MFVKQSIYIYIYCNKKCRHVISDHCTSNHNKFFCCCKYQQMPLAVSTLYSNITTEQLVVHISGRVLNKQSTAIYKKKRKSFWQFLFHLETQYILSQLIVGNVSSIFASDYCFKYRNYTQIPNCLFTFTLPYSQKYHQILPYTLPYLFEYTNIRP